LPQFQFLLKTVLTYAFNRLWANKTKYSIISKNQKLLIVWSTSRNVYSNNETWRCCKMQVTQRSFLH